MNENSAAQIRRKFWPIPLTVALVVLANYRLALPGATFGEEGDFTRQFVPARAFAALSWGSGRIPEWNPYVLSGAPFVGSGNNGAFYPANLSFDLFNGLVGMVPTPRGTSWLVVAHMALAAVGMLLLGRSLGLSETASAIGGLSFGLSGFLVGHAGHLPIVEGAAWLPWSCWGVLALWKRPSPRRVALLAGALAMPALAGHPPTVVQVWVLAGGVAATFAIAGTRNQTGLRRVATFAGCGVAACLLAAGIASVQIIPTVEFSRIAARPGSGWAFASAYSLPIRMLPALAAPHIWGGSNATAAGPEFAWEYWGYIGAIPLLLAPVGAWIVITSILSRRRNDLKDGQAMLVDSIGVAAMAMVAIGILLALGPRGLILRAVFEIVPQIERIRVPARWLLAVNFGGVLLAMIGVDAFKAAHGVTSTSRDGKATRVSRLTAVSLAAAAGATLLVGISLAAFPELAVTVSGPTAAAVLCALSLGWISLLARRGPTNWVGIVGLVLLTVDLTFSSTGYFVWKTEDPYPDRRASESIPAGLHRVETDSRNLRRSTDAGVLFGQQRSNGDDSLVAARYHELRSTMGPSESPGAQFDLFTRAEVANRVLDIYSVRYLITNRTLSTEGATKYRFSGRAGGYDIYENPDAMPKAWLADRVLVVPDPVERWVESSRADPWEVAILESPAREVPQRSRSRDQTPTADIGGGSDTDGNRWGQAEVVSYEPGRIRVDTDSDRPSILVLSENFHPRWRVSTDGEPAELITVQHGLIGVELPPGRHSTNFDFSSLTLPASLSGISSMIWVLLMLGRPRSGRSRHEREGSSERSRDPSRRKGDPKQSVADR